jgi:hypothetical protein
MTKIIFVVVSYFFFFTDSELGRVPDELGSLAEVWYLDGSSIFKNNSLGKP